MITVDTLVHVREGDIVGSRENGVDVYRGIPYAKAPFGELRLRGPERAEPWDDLFVAQSFGATAPQPVHANRGLIPDVPEPIIPGDAILNLNVWTPSARDERALPVLFWIHGGGFVGGCSAATWYDGTSFAQGGMVVVSINYRLGAEGFLDVAGATRNRAVLDWILALDWVQDNIAAFGGDPSKVTIGGQSAGGLAVMTLLTSPRARGLFSQAVIASSVAWVGAAPEAHAAMMAERVRATLGADAATRDAVVAFDRDELVAAQVAALSPAEQIRGLQASGQREAPLVPWIPVIDGDVVPRLPFESIAAGVSDDIPVLVGTTRNEFRWAGLAGEQPDDATVADAQRVFADDALRRPTDEFVRLRADAPAPTFHYEFAWRSTADPVRIGASHSLDLPFLFNTLDAPHVARFAGDDLPQDLADDVHGAVSRFIRTGDPGWEAATASRHPVMVFDTPSVVQEGLTFDGAS